MSKILIFGATGSIGSQLARALVARGRQVHLIGRQANAVADLAQELSASFSDAVAEGTSDGQIAGLVWAVGSILLKPLSRLTETEFQNTFQLNVTSAALAIQAAQPALKAGHGAVLMFSSVAAHTGFTSHAAIAAAKAGVEGLGRALAAEFAPDIRVNVIAPSLSESKMASPLISNPAMAKGLAQMHPLGRLGTAADFSSLACLLLDNQQSGWITGAVFPVDGGRGNLTGQARTK